MNSQFPIGQGQRNVGSAGRAEQASQVSSQVSADPTSSERVGSAYYVDSFYNESADANGFRAESNLMVAAARAVMEWIRNLGKV